MSLFQKSVEKKFLNDLDTALVDKKYADFEITEAMLRYFIERAHNRRTMVKPRIIICVPYGITEVEKRAVKESAESAGAREVHLIEEPMAAAIGAGLPVQEATGSMVVDIGGGTTEVAVISLGGIVTSKSIRVGGDALDNYIVNFVKKEHSLMIGERTAEEVKIKIGSAILDNELEDMEIRGRDLVSGLPKTLIIKSSEIYEALKEPVNNIIDAIKSNLEKTPPELSSDIMEQGIVLTEIAPGVDLERDILCNMEFKPIISGDLKIMDERIFSPQIMGLKENLILSEATI